MDLFVASQPGAPYIAARKGRYYVFWYDKILRRTRRITLKTSSLVVAESRADAYFAATLDEAGAPEGETLFWLAWSKRICRKARDNAAAKGRVFDLTAEYVATLVEAQDHKCAITLFPFSQVASKRNPFAPSIDQIVPAAGYTETNVRIVLTLVNVAMSEWGPGPFLRVVKHLSKSASQRSKTSLHALGKFDKVQLD